MDATQAIGKMPVYVNEIDLVTFAPHKFNGLHGIGALLKRQGIHIESLLHGGVSTTTYRSGTPTVALIKSMEVALNRAISLQVEKVEYVTNLNRQLRASLNSMQGIDINSPIDASPFILNVSTKGIKARELQEALGELEIYISTKSACTTLNTPSRAVYAMTKDRKRALNTLRISISHLTQEEEIAIFLDKFKICYQQLKG